jgi:hypothetical protein
MNKKQVLNKLQYIALIFSVLFSNASSKEIVDLTFIKYGGLGNIESADTVTPKVFRSFKAWDNYIDANVFADTRELPQTGDFPFWKKDSLYFKNSIAIAFEGNRIASVLEVSSSDDKIIVNYKLSEDEYTITDYQFDPQGREYEATAIVFYFLRSETIDISEKEIVFQLNNVSVKPPRRAKPVHSVQGKAFKTKKVNISGRSLSESNTSGIYIIKSARYIFKRIEIK